MMKSPYDKYRQSSVQTSTPEQLVIMLYDGAIRFIRIAVDGMDKRNYEITNLNVSKAQTIISELMSTLDYTYDISKNLYSLYEYIYHLLIQSNIKKEKALAEEALGYIQELKDTWLEAIKMGTPKLGETTSHG
ncbi:flagellar export chaperone FliS [Paenibacillus sp. IHBB 10380]|uniref:flagellar export chaperone FliS n=1 Tax=Paenibacillus sp. IHBB 10380 TaxID=1566358 RepID=UPI0009E324FF|nr:flagellar export chaperone FliS [Paenibacillus sp. IHBB 10380]